MSYLRLKTALPLILPGRRGAIGPFPGKTIYSSTLTYGVSVTNEHLTLWYSDMDHPSIYDAWTRDPAVVLVSGWITGGRIVII